MSNQSLGNKVQDDLERAVASGLLPNKVQDQAKKLLDRLKQPVRLSLLGLPRSGKSTVLNLLVGSNILPEGVRLPTLNLTYGAREQAICTLPDGSKKTLSTVDAKSIAALSPVFVELQAPLPALKKISVLEVVAPNEETAIHRASQWAAKRSEVILWCTSGFYDNEQRIWNQMPDHIKDHAFLLLTRKDVLQEEGTYDVVFSAVSSVPSGEFNQILPIATRHAIAARQSDGTVDKDIMRESGGLALISAVLKQVEQGRRSAVDMADVLLLQNADALADMGSSTAEDAPEPIAAPEPAPSPTAEAKMPVMPKPAPRETAADGTDSVTSGIEKLRTIAARRAEEMTSPPAPAVLQPATRQAYQHAVDRLQNRAQALLEKIEQMGDDAPAEVITLAVEDMQWLCDYLSENGDDADEALHRARDTAFDAADLVQLMEMEKRDSAALEAVTVMLQLKRELQADMAA